MDHHVLRARGQLDILSCGGGDDMGGFSDKTKGRCLEPLGCPMAAGGQCGQGETIGLKKEGSMLQCAGCNAG